MVTIFNIGRLLLVFGFRSADNWVLAFVSKAYLRKVNVLSSLFIFVSLVWSVNTL